MPDRASRLQRIACALVITANAALYSLATAAAADLPRANLVLKSAISADPVANTVVLPIHKGRAGDRTAWFIVMDSSDAADAARRGVVHAPLLSKVGVVQEVEQAADTVIFAGAPEFSPARTFTAGPTGFPPAEAKPGALASGQYSPFVRIRGTSAIVNAPIIATGDGPFDVTAHTNTADRVLAIDTAARTVTLLLSHGYAEGRKVVYISTEASDPGVAAMERAVYMPALSAAGGTISIFGFANGQTGRENPNAQGLSYVSLDGGLNLEAALRNSAGLHAPLNILAAFPTGATAATYSPLWELTLTVWSAQAVATRMNGLQKDQEDVYRLIRDKMVTGPNGGSPQPTGLLINCPVIAWLDAAP